MNLFKSAIAYSELIKLGHTLFALPFALSALCLAYINGYSIAPARLLWIVAAFAAARSTAMGFNRFADADIDILNPRTKNRPSVTGKISLREVKIFTAVSAAIFVFSAFMINDICFWLSFPALFVLTGYSYAKRFTAAAHYILGVALAMAPIGAWIAATDGFSPRILCLGGVLFFHISGFDLVYSLQDREFDIAHKLFSVPSRFGRRATLLLAAFSFASAAALLFITGILFELNAAFYACVATTAMLYAGGYLTIERCGMRMVNLVFFYENVAISALILLGTAANIFGR